MEFISRPEDRKPRWIITEGSSEPKLIEEKCEEEEGSGEGVGGGEEGGEKGEKVACVEGTHTQHATHMHTAHTHTHTHTHTCTQKLLTSSHSSQMHPRNPQQQRVGRGVARRRELFS